MNFFVVLAFGTVFYAENSPNDMATIKVSVCQYPAMVLFLTWKRAVFVCVVLRAVSWPHLLVGAGSACVVELQWLLLFVLLTEVSVLLRNSVTRRGLITAELLV